MPPAISVIVPVFDEQDAIQPFLRACLPRLEAVVAGPLAGRAFEVLFIDDGSRDGTAAAVMAAATSDFRIKLVRLSRNFGKEAALAAGFRYAAGDAVVPMDVDLQDPPDVLPRMVDAWLAGGEVINAVRNRRTGDPLFKRTTAQLFYRLYNWIADSPIKQNVGDFRLLDRAAVDALNRLTEGSRFTKALYSWIGFRNIDIGYDRPEAPDRRSKWRTRGLVRLALDGLVASTTAPLRIWSLIGLSIGLYAVGYGVYIVIKTLILGVDLPGYASTLVMVLFLGGLNLLSLGILGEYIGRMAQELRSRPLFVVREIHGVQPVAGGMARSVAQGGDVAAPERQANRAR